MSDNYFFNKKIPIPLWLFISLPLAAYAAWEVYWYKQVGLNFIKWHTHYAVFAYLWFIGVLLLGFIHNQGKRKNLLLGFTTFVLTLALAEWILGFVGFNKTYIENRSGFYQSLFNLHSRDSLRSYYPLSNHKLATPEYDFTRQTNRFGFSDKEFYSNTNKILIQTYGDSFTEGDGAPADSSYPAILRTLLGEGYTVQNYGICGNDPGFYITQFGKVGSTFKPDVIVLCYCTFDFTTDVMSRSGIERFVDGGWQTRKGPWWEVFYAMSYVSRLFFHAAGIHYNNFFMTQAEKVKQLKALEPKWNEIFVEIARLAEQQHTKVLLFKKPERSEIDLNQYDYDMSFFDSLLVNYPVFHHVDLLPAYRDIMKIGNGGATVHYYWEKDGHHNPHGYAAMAQLVKAALKKNNLLTLPPLAN